MAKYMPEGQNAKDNAILNEKALYNAFSQGKILEGQVEKCDNEHNLIVKFGAYTGLMEREETVMGIKEGTVREIAIISRVNKTVSFRIKDILQKDGAPFPLLTRASLQEECLEYMLNTFKAGDVISAAVTHLEQFGAFVDIGCGVTSLISIDNISVSRINHPKDRFTPGQKIFAVIKEVDYENKRFVLSHKELLGTWLQNTKLFSPGQTVRGIIRSIESYGAFIELTPNLAGLAEINENMKEGMSAAVYIKSIIPEKMKVKLNVIDIGEKEIFPAPFSYFITSGHIDEWIYSPAVSTKTIKTQF